MLAGSIVVLMVGVTSAGAANTPTGATPSSEYIAISPCRTVDTRNVGTAGQIAGGQANARTYQIVTTPTAGVWTAQGGVDCGIPTSATAVAINLTMVSPTMASWAAAYPAGLRPNPMTSTVDWTSSSAPIANGAHIGLGTGTNAGKITVEVGRGSAAAVIDVVGYYQAAPSYKAGTGINLGAGNTFGITPAYALPQGCTLGKVVTPNGAGGWSCTTPAHDDRFGTNTSLAAAGNGETCTLGELILNAGSVANGTPAAGQLLPIQQNTAIFSLLGTTYGGNGTTNFALPDMRPYAPNNTTYSICMTGVFPSRQ